MIIKFENVIDSATKLFILTEYAEGGELFDRVKRARVLPEDEVQLLFLQLSVALQYLHSRGIMHR